jgi:hypothetical protein
MIGSPFVTRLCAAAACGILLIAAGCSSDSSPTSPTPTTTTPPAQSNPTPTPTPQAAGAVSVSINPNPVPHSGATIPDAPGCAGVRYTWFYEQVLRETGGSAVTFTNRIDLFDDRETNNRSVNVVVPANGSVSVQSRWCSSNRAAHSSQTRWTGTDASGRSVSVMSPRVTLSTPQ